MRYEGFRSSESALELKGVTGGRFAAGIALTFDAPPAELALVRPIVDDSVTEWIIGFERALEVRRGEVVCFVSEEPLTAAALASETAAWFGDKGVPVTLIDGNVEEPAIAKALREDGDEGLVDAVCFGASAESVARRTLASGVRLMTAGSAPVSADSLFEGEALRTTIVALGESGDIVFLVLPARLASAAGRIADVLVVIGSSRKRLEDVLEGLAPADRCRRSVAVLVTTRAAADAGEGDEGPAAEAPAGIEESIGGPDTREERRPRLARWATVAVVIALVFGGYWIWTVIRDAGQPRAPSERVAEQRAGATRSTDADATGEGEALGGADAGTEERGDTDDAVARRVEEPRPEGDATGESPPVVAEVASTPPRGPGADAVVPPADGRYYAVFVSSHRYRSAARRDSSRLERQSLPATIVEVDLGESGHWYRVGLRSTYSPKARATQLLDTVREFGYDGAWIERSRDR